MKVAGKVTSGLFLLIAAILAVVAGVAFFGPVNHKINKDAGKKYILSGKVINGQNQVVVGARITILNDSKNDGFSSMTAVTDGDGYYKIEKITRGTYTHVVKADGYRTLKQSVVINKDKNLIITLQTSKQ